MAYKLVWSAEAETDFRNIGFTILTNEEQRKIKQRMTHAPIPQLSIGITLMADRQQRCGCFVVANFDFGREIEINLSTQK